MQKVMPLPHSQIDGCIGTSYDPMIMATPQMKRDMVMLEYLGVNLYHDHGEKAEVYDIPPPSLHPWPTPHLGYHYVIFL